jgi:hypothetical protein
MSAEGRREEGARWNGGKREEADTYFGLDDQSIEESNPASTAPVLSNTPVSVVVRAVPRTQGSREA